MKLFLQVRSILYKTTYVLDRLMGLSKNNTTVLCYHSFKTSSNGFSVDLKTFEKQIIDLSRLYKFISLKEVIDILNGKKTSGKKVHITIDDGFKSVLNILPITRRYNVPITLFLLSKPEEKNVAELDTKEELLSWSDIKKLIAEGWEVGCHSATHAQFSCLSDVQMQSEIINSKKYLEKKLGRVVDSFAFPKGFYSDKIIDIVKEAGYKYSFSVLPGTITSFNNKYLLPRTIIDKTHSETNITLAITSLWFLLRKWTNRFKLWERFLS